MALTKKIEYSYHRNDKYRIRYKRWSYIFDDGEEIGLNCKTFTIVPDDDWTVADYQKSGKPVPDQVRKMCEDQFTAEIIATYNEEKIVNEVEGEPTGQSFNTEEEIDEESIEEV